ncbi:TPA: hypothetical protein U2Q74_002817 [Klebsiella aerogenes]|nr:hypothetical protein [Klebsiella aerogenes]
MDTTEQVNGYYFDGKSNLSEIELLFWLLMDKSYKQFGDLLDYFAWGSMILSLPLVPVRGKIDYRRATKGTSPLSLVFRKVFTGSFETRKKTLTIKSILRKDWAYTTSIGGYIGRWVPWIGVVVTVYDIGVITTNVVHRYRLITGK